MIFCGININCFTREELFKDTSDAKIVVTVNAEAIVRAQSELKLLNIINTSTTTIDGQIPLWLYRIRHKEQTIEKISGSDVIYDICERSVKNKYRVFLLGGNEESNLGAVEALRNKYPSLEVGGFSPPYEPYPFTNKHNDEILSKIKSFNPQILFVGFGMGKQEFWEADNYEYLNQINIKMIIGCGGTFDFVSGRIKRAPLCFQKIGLEGVWRLVTEPKFFRFRRLLLSCKIFYYYIVLELLKR